MGGSISCLVCSIPDAKKSGLEKLRSRSSKAVICPTRKETSQSEDRAQQEGLLVDTGRVLQSLCNHLPRSTTYLHILSVLCMSLNVRFTTDSTPTLSASSKALTGHDSSSDPGRVILNGEVTFSMD